MNQTTSNNSSARPWHVLTLIILAGESIFLLPFVLPRVFRPTVLDTFGIDNTELGICFSYYGIAATISYLLGGFVADRIQPRILMAVALLLTAAGGLFLLQFPGYNALKWLYAYWGVTTILLFWAAMIKATRIWGGHQKQGAAFGFLEGGRGAIAAGIALVGVFLFAAAVNTDSTTALPLKERQSDYAWVIAFASMFVAVVAILILLLLKYPKDQLSKKSQQPPFKWSSIGAVLQLPAVWLLMIVVCCAYFGYKTTDLFSQYAQEIMGYNTLDAPKVGMFLLWLRPITGIAIALLADRYLKTNFLLIGFIIMGLGALLFASGWITANTTVLFFFTAISTAIGIYALRTFYFMALEKGKIPLVLTGTAVGLISLAGFTPDIFAGPLQGYFLDGMPGIKGYQMVFFILAVFSLAGAVTAWFFHRQAKRS